MSPDFGTCVAVFPWIIAYASNKLDNEKHKEAKTKNNNKQMMSWAEDLQGTIEHNLPLWSL